MNVVKIRDVSIGEGMPKICVPIVGKTKEEILRVAKEIHESVADLVEWRTDWFEDVFSIEEVQTVLVELRQVLGEMPLLFTFRTKEEGGEKAISAEQYTALNQVAIRTGVVDLIDLEVFSQHDTVENLIATAHEQGVKVVGSNHDFKKTPAKDEIIRRLCHMQTVGVDIAKIAVMPRKERDVVTLLSATEEMRTEHAKGPIVTMSMSSMGIVSRLAGEAFGSAITFGALGKVSAPGQIDVNELKKFLQIAHGVE